MSPNQSAISQRGWVFHTARGGIDLGDRPFHPRNVGVVEVLKDISSGDKNLSSPGAAGPRRWPEGQLSPRAGSMSLSQSATSQWGWSFHTVRGGIDPGDHRFRRRVCRSCKGMKGYLVRGCELILRVRPVVLGFPHRTGRFRPGGSPFSSPGCRSCRFMTAFLIRGWDPVVPGWRWLCF